MSRETDSSSSGPQGRGGAAYPSGTPPYGSRQYPSRQPGQDGPGGAADASGEPEPDGARSEPRTETTLTTRIRINIPGSRPIPPVVMRKPMSSPVQSTPSPGAPGVPPVRPGAAETEGERTAAMPVIGSGQPSEPAADPAEEEKDKSPSDWFAPRKPSGSSATNGAGLKVPGIGGGGAGTGTPPAGTPTGGAVPPPGTSAPFASDAPGAGGPHLPHSSLSDLARDDRSPAPDGGRNGFAPGPHTPPLGVRTPGAPGGQGGPAGPTAGPATGSMPVAPRPGADRPAVAPGQDPTPGAPRPPVPGAVQAGPPGVTRAPAPGAPTAPGPAAPGSGPRGTAAPRLSDDTAVLTPQKPAPGPGAPAPSAPGPGPGAGPAPGPGSPPGGNVSGDTLTSGVPVVRPDPRTPFPAGEGPRTPSGERDFPAPGPPGGGGPQGPAATADRPASRPAPPAPARKGRSKLVIAGAGVVGLFGIAYGAGLLLNHSDVPKSTTVLGVDIGGGTRDQAISKLEGSLGKRTAAPLQLTIGDRKAELTPEKAGLGLDSHTTVRNAAGSDYNPVSVIGSLFGGERVAEPVMLVDEEKLRVALTDLAGGSGSAVEGTIEFTPGKAVAVPGKPGQALDVGRAVALVREAYRTQVETGASEVVALPVTARQPAIDQAEIARAMKEFAEPAMSGRITIKAGTKSIQFGPARSLPRILSMKPVDGKLVEVYDKKAIDELLEGVFDGILITKGDGKQHQVSPDDVAQVMGPALRGKTPQERTAVIELNPS
ncbi:hypothetical protein ACIBCM_11000 [Streptomyces sp. NPDC051018]|uniref:hypothetical protein n=1 Tax=Streptomyces sp. NPDC051018 TaxID=3365639 RepID=UPI00379D010B